MLNVKQYLEFEYMMKKIGERSAPLDVYDAYIIVKDLLITEREDSRNSKHLRNTAGSCVANLEEVMESSNFIVRKAKCLYIVITMKEAWRNE